MKKLAVYILVPSLIVGSCGAGISEYRNHLRKCRLKSSGQRMRLLRKSPGLSGSLIADTIQSRTVLHPPCQHGLSSDGQRAKQRGSQK